MSNCLYIRENINFILFTYVLISKAFVAIENCGFYHAYCKMRCVGLLPIFYAFALEPKNLLKTNDFRFDFIKKNIHVLVYV